MHVYNCGEDGGGEWNNKHANDERREGNHTQSSLVCGVLRGAADRNVFRYWIANLESCPATKHDGKFVLPLVGKETFFYLCFSYLLGLAVAVKQSWRRREKCLETESQITSTSREPRVKKKSIQSDWRHFSSAILKLRGSSKSVVASQSSQ